MHYAVKALLGITIRHELVKVDFINVSSEVIWSKVQTFILVEAMEVVWTNAGLVDLYLAVELSRHLVLSIIASLALDLSVIILPLVEANVVDGVIAIESVVIDVCARTKVLVTNQDPLVLIEDYQVVVVDLGD